MASGCAPGRAAAAGGVMSRAWPNITALIESGGQIMLGTAKPIANAAIAHDGQKTLVMLRQDENEALDHLLSRLDDAIASARRSGKRIDEINKPKSNVRYEL